MGGAAGSILAAAGPTLGPRAGLVAAALGVALALVALLEARADGSAGRRAARAGVRSLVLTALAAALAGPATWVAVEAPRRLGLVLDPRVLATPAGREATASLLADARAAARLEGVGLFGLWARATPVAFDASRPPAPPSEPGASVLAPALAAARLSLPAEAAGAVVVVSDGHADGAGASEAAAALVAAGVPVRCVVMPPPVDRAPRPEVEALDVPDEVRGPFAVRAAVTGPLPASARLLVDGAEAARRAVTAASAVEAEVAFDGLVLPPGLHEVTVAVAAEGVAGAEASVRRSLVRVLAPPRALLVTDAAGSSFARRALSAQGLEVVLASAKEAPSALASTPADLVVLDADAAPTLPEAAAVGLARRVRAGLGLVLLAGRDREAWARLATGPLADLLPVAPEAEPPPAPPPPAPPPEPDPEPPPDPDPPKPEPGPGLVAERRPEEALPISLLLVIDRSGSMAVQGKLEMAVLAAEEAASTLAPTDRVGVVSFADEATMDTPFRPASTVETLGLVGALRADGNTDIYGALALADRAMRGERSPIRHVILLTDGMQSGTAYYTDLVTGMAEQGITLTTVGLGDRTDEFLLKRLARQGGGRFFLAPGPKDLPRILTRDTRTIVEARTQEATKARLDDPKRPPTKPPEPKPPEPKPPAPKPPAPPRPKPPKPPPTPPPTPPPPAPAGRLPLRRARPHEASAGLPTAAWPAVLPPLPSKVRPMGSPLLEREDGRPVLAAGRPGLGRVLVWALPSDDEGFPAWGDASRLFAQMARSVVPPVDPGAVAVARVTGSAQGDVLRLSLPDGVSPEDAASAVVVTGIVDGREEKAIALGVEDGEATFLLPQAAPGADLAVARLAVRARNGATAPLPPVTYVPRSGRAEPAGSDPEALGAALGRAPVAANAPGLFDVPHRTLPRERPLAPWCIALALLLLPLDAWLHRRAPVARRAA